MSRPSTLTKRRFVPRSSASYAASWNSQQPSSPAPGNAIAFPSCNVFTDLVICLHALSSWGLAKCVSFDGADQLSIRFMESTLASGRADLVCKFVGDVGLAICAQAPGNDVRFVILQWLKEKKFRLISLTLLGDLKTATLEEVMGLVRFVGKEGLVLQDEEFMEIINHDLVLDPKPQQAMDERFAQARVVVTILGKFNLEAYILEYEACVWNWLERWQVE